VFDADVQRIVYKVSEKRIGNVVHPERPQQPPPPAAEHLLQISDRKECQKVSKEDSNPEEDKHPESRRGADPAEPSDQADMDEKRGSKGETKLARAFSRAETSRRTRPSAGCRHKLSRTVETKTGR